MQTYQTYTDIVNSAERLSADTSLPEKEQAFYRGVLEFHKAILTNDYTNAFYKATTFINKLSFWKDGLAYNTVLILTQLIDPKTGDSLVPIEVASAELYNLLGLAYRDIGNTSAAITYTYAASEKYDSLQKVLESTEVLCDMVGMLRNGGKIVLAVEFAYRAYEQAKKITDDLTQRYWKAVALRILGYSLMLTGDTELSKQALEKSLSFWKDEYKGDRQGEGLVSAFLSHYYINNNDFEKAQEYADRAWTLADDQKFERDYIRAGWLQILIAIRKENPDYDYAKKRLAELQPRADALDIPEHIANLSNAASELALAKGEIEVATTYTYEVLNGPYFSQAKLQHFEAKMLACRILIAQGNIEDLKLDIFDYFYEVLNEENWYARGAQQVMAIMQDLNITIPNLPEAPIFDLKI